MGSLLGYAKGELPLAKMAARQHEVHLQTELAMLYAMPRRLRALRWLGDKLVYFGWKLRGPSESWKSCNSQLREKLYKALCNAGG